MNWQARDWMGPRPEAKRTIETGGMNAFNADMDQRRGRQQLKRGLLAAKSSTQLQGQSVQVEQRPTRTSRETSRGGKESVVSKSIIKIDRTR